MKYFICIDLLDGIITTRVNTHSLSMNLDIFLEKTQSFSEEVIKISYILNFIQKHQTNIFALICL